MMRLLMFALCLAAGLSAAVAFEGARQTEAAMNAVATAAALPDPPQRARVASTAAEALEASWARPLAWSARANEALSALYAVRYDAENDRRWSARSLAFAMRSVELSPAAPQTWARIAKLAQLGEPGAPCAPLLCLERSWLAAAVTDPVTDCARIRLAVEARLDPAVLRERILFYARSGVRPQDVNACLDFLAPSERIQYVLLSRSVPAGH